MTFDETGSAVCGIDNAERWRDCISATDNSSLVNSGSVDESQKISRFIQGHTVLSEYKQVDPMTPGWLHGKIKVVPQAPILFETASRENVLCGNRERTDAEMGAAVRFANARQFVQKRHQGLEDRMFSDHVLPRSTNPRSAIPAENHHIYEY
jgi:ABC-type transport system involved in cytochrome bd biosynthesis fused ATPase/permease subunit